ncbi:MAG: hypothetical protein R2755_16105 [Acidimicrobiales bacterium]
MGGIGGERGAERHRVLGVHVDGDRPADLGADHLGDEGDARRPADQQHDPHVGRHHVGRAQRPLQCAEGFRQGRADHGLELVAGHAQLGADAGQQHRDLHVGVGRQRLLGLHAVGPQPRQARGHRRVVGVHLVQRTVEEPVDVLEHGGVEVHPTEAVHPFRWAHQREAGVGLAQHGGVERAAAEVVDRHHLAHVDVLGLGVVDGRRLRFADQLQRRQLQTERRHGLPQQRPLGLAPVRRMGQRQPIGRATLLLDGGLHDHRQHGGHQPVGGEPDPAEVEGVGIAHAALELAGHPLGLGHAAAVGALADEQLAVGPGVHHRGHDRRAVAEGDDAGLAVDGGRGR